jgi:hypothetical protein
MSLQDYQIITKKKVNYNQSYIDYKKKKLIIKDIHLNNKLKMLIMSKFDPIEGKDGMYLGFVTDNVLGQCRNVSVSDYGYYSVSASDIIRSLRVTSDTNVKLEKEEEDDTFIVYKLLK